MDVQRDYLTHASRSHLLFEILQEAANLIENQELDRAQKLLHDFPELSIKASATDLKAFIFLRALWKNFDESDFNHAGNLYLQDFAAQQIDLFNLMATKMPIVSLAVQTANDILSSIILQHSEVVLVDVGIGTGQQIVQLIQQMKTFNDSPKRLKVVGIDPSASSLKIAETNIRALSSPYFKVSFDAVLGSAESIADSEWERIKNLGEVKVINEAFALHHVQSHSQGSDYKHQVLQKLRTLNPAGFVLSEPHSNHQSSHLGVRFKNAWKHFGLVFEVIDAQKMIPAEKNAMKLHFFAREIEDILGGSEVERSERHESVEMWVDRLRESKFRILSCDGLIQKQHRNSAQVSCRKDFISLDYAGETIVAIIAASA